MRWASLSVQRLGFEWVVMLLDVRSCVVGIALLELRRWEKRAMQRMLVWVLRVQKQLRVLVDVDFASRN